VQRTGILPVDTVSVGSLSGPALPPFAHRTPTSQPFTSSRGRPRVCPRSSASSASQAAPSMTRSSPSPRSSTTPSSPRATHAQPLRTKRSGSASSRWAT